MPRASLLALVLLLSPPASAGGGPCDRIRWVGEDPKLNEVEKRLVCGDQDNEGWREVPLTQAKNFLEAFLQTRGYHYPRFEPRGETLYVDIGTATIIKQVTG